MAPPSRPAWIGLGLATVVTVCLLAAPLRAQSVTADAVALTLNNPSAPLVDGPRRVPVFFPPTPPILGAAAPNPTFLDPRLTAPAELAAFVNEPFYAPLGTLYAEKQLSKNMAARLAAFVEQRTALETDLITRLAALGPLSPAERERALAAACTAQERALADWEGTAEKLRRDCASGGADTSVLRRFLPADPAPGDEIQRQQRELTGVLAIASYQDGLSAPQRDLLRELAATLQPESFSPERKLVCMTDRHVVFFLPGALRIVVPTTLPETLATKLAAFEDLKAELNRELSDAISRSRSETDFGRGRRWKKLAATQASRLADLERQAEELRGEFARHHVSFQAASVPRLPPDFAARFDRYRHDCDQVAALLGQRLDGPLRAMLAYKPDSGTVPYRVHTTQIMGGFGGMNGNMPSVYLHALEFLPARDASEDQRKFLAQIKPVIDAFRLEQTENSLALAETRKALEQELEKILGPDNKLPSDRALSAFVSIAAQADEWGRFSEYRQAALVPGLSPSQRRLMLGVALRRLARPLPGGELLLGP